MKIENVKRCNNDLERKISVGLALTQKQIDFIKKNGLSVSKIMSEALKELGYK